MSKTETPLTDAVCITPVMGSTVTEYKWGKVQELARRLERERNELMEALKDAQFHWGRNEPAEYRATWDAKYATLFAKMKETT